MVTITDGVEFDTIAREWRCKWSPDNDKKSLQEIQKLVTATLTEIQTNISGEEPKIQRVVCGGCLDYKVIISLPVEQFNVWNENKFVPEEKFLDKLKEIEGVTQIETQTYTLMNM